MRRCGRPSPARPGGSELSYVIDSRRGAHALMSGGERRPRVSRGVPGNFGSQVAQQGRRSAARQTQRATDAEEVDVPAHDEQRIRSGHAGIVTRISAMCPGAFHASACCAANRHASRNFFSSRAIPGGPGPSPGEAQPRGPGAVPRGSTAQGARGRPPGKHSPGGPGPSPGEAQPRGSVPGPAQRGGSALADPAQTRLGGPLGRQVLAVTPVAARALVVPALPACGADHELIVADVAGVHRGQSRTSLARGRPTVG
jgi:hypothetical protein